MSYIQFQKPETGVSRFRSLYGRSIDMLPLLFTGKDITDFACDVERSPLSARHLLYERTYCKNGNDRNLFLNNFISTGDVIISDPKGSGEIVIGLYSDPNVEALLKSIHPNTPLKRGSLQVSIAHYQAIRKEGLIITPEGAYALKRNFDDSKKEKEKFWDFITQGDRQLCSDYLVLVEQAEGGNIDYSRGIGFDVRPGLRQLLFTPYNNGPSVAVCDGYLNICNNHVGRVACPQEEQILETRIRYEVLPAIMSGESFAYDGVLYAPVDSVSNN